MAVVCGGSDDLVKVGRDDDDVVYGMMMITR